MRRDVLHFQRPLLVLVLIVSGARLELQTPWLGLGVICVLIRTAAKLAGGWAAATVVGPVASDNLGLSLLAPGILGLALLSTSCARRRPTPRRSSRLRRLAHRLGRYRQLHLEDKAEPLNEATRGASSRHCGRRLGAPYRWHSVARIGGTALALGFTLVGAWIAGDALRRFQLPRLTGYLLFGVLAGPTSAISSTS